MRKVDCFSHFLVYGDSLHFVEFELMLQIQNNFLEASSCKIILNICTLIKSLNSIK